MNTYNTSDSMSKTSQNTPEPPKTQRGGRPPTDAYWVERIRILAANNPRISYTAIARELEAEGGSGAPSPRTVERFAKKFRSLPPQQQADYRYFSWPETMEQGLLPWEASRAALELAEHFRDHGPP